MFHTLGGVEVKLKYIVPLVHGRTVGSGTGNAKWKATPMAKRRNAINKASPRRQISWLTESGALGWL